MKIGIKKNPIKIIKNYSMINLYGAHITSISIHRVGNKINNESIFLSEDIYHADDELTPLLKEYFLNHFEKRKKIIFSLYMM